jgi:hypothetical protein
MGEEVIYRRTKCIHCPMLIQLYFSVNMLYIFKIERNNSIHSSVAVVDYLLVPPIIPYRDRASKSIPRYPVSRTFVEMHTVQC